MKKPLKTSKELSIIILNYNVEKLLIACLKSIPNNDNWEIIVVDNASTDNSVQSVKSLFPKVTVIANKTNPGFAAGNNIGIKKASGEYVLLLNPDTEVEPNSISTVLTYMQSHPDVGAATCKVEMPNGNLDYSCHRGFPTPSNTLLHLIGLKKLSTYTATNIPNKIHEIDALSGAFALVRKTAGDQVNWLDEDYFFNGEDIDFCYKLKERKWLIVYIPNVRIIHYKGASSQATSQTRRRWAINSTKVMYIFYQKHLAVKYSMFFNVIVYIGIKMLEKVRLLKIYLTLK